MSLEETVRLGSLEIYPQYTMYGGQGTLLFGSEEKRLIAMKVYGHIFEEDLKEAELTSPPPKIDFPRPEMAERYEQTFQHRRREWDALSILGEDIEHFERFPTVYTKKESGTINEFPYIIMSLGVGKGKGLPQERIDDYFRKGKILNFKQVLHGRFGQDDPRSRVQERILDMSWTSKLDFCLKFLEITEKLKNNGIIHNDLKPDQLLLLSFSEGERYLEDYICILTDFAMHVNAEELKEKNITNLTKKLLLRPTNITYDSPGSLKTYIDLASGRDELEALEGLVRDPDLFYERDEVPAIRIAYGILFGEDPVREKAIELIQEDEEFKRLSKKRMRKHSASLEREYSLALSRIFLLAYEEYLRNPGQYSPPITHLKGQKWKRKLDKKLEEYWRLINHAS